MTKLCIECDACIDICPVDCLTMTPNGVGSRPALAAQGAGAET
jgi:formate hydrogenlyase subunit 6/NADH:ubiquinone oxidoreductase subunit I